MSLLKRVEQDFQKAIKTGNANQLSALRNLRTALHNKEIELKPKDEKLTDEVIVSVVQSLVKKHKESIKMFKKGNRDDLLKKEKKELEALSSYLPKQLSDDKIKQIVLSVINKIGAAGPQDFGKIMGPVMSQAKGQADGNKVRAIVQQQLNKLK